MSRLFRYNGLSMSIKAYTKAIGWGGDGEMRSLCATCGYPYGIHYRDLCPTAKDNKAKGYHITPIRPRKRSTREILRIKFEVLLNEYGAYKAWKENVMNFAFRQQFSDNKCPTKISDVWTKVDPNNWNMLFNWYNLNNAGGNIYWNDICVEWREKYAEFKKKNS